MFVGGGVIGQKNALALWANTCMSASSPENTYTFNGRNLNMADPSRVLAALIQSTNANSSNVGGVTSVSLNGVGATQLYVSPGSLIGRWSLWIAASPTGTSGTIQVNRSTGNGFSSAYTAVFSLYYLRDPASEIDVQEVVVASPASVNLVTRSGGVLIATSSALASDPDISWTGATVQNNTVGGIGGGVQMSSALVSPTGGSAAYNVEADTTGGAGLLAASFR